MTSSKVKQILLKCSKYGALLFASGLFTLFVAEALYRLHWINFYKAEYEFLNPKKNDEQDKTILVLGDSFTATYPCYVDHLRESHPNYNWINAAVPGTGVIEARLIAKKILRKRSVDAIIYQIYVGNDLLDIQHETNWKEIGWIKNMYWTLSDKFYVLRYLSYKSGQIRYAKNEDLEEYIDPKESETFDPASFHPWEKAVISADPATLENSVMITGGYQRKMKKLKKHLNKMFASTEIPVYLLLIPHATQVQIETKQNYSELGATFSENFPFGTVDYPFAETLVSYCEDHQQIEILNPLPTLMESADSSAVYFANDPHLNAHGQQILSEFISRSIFNMPNP